MKNTILTMTVVAVLSGTRATAQMLPEWFGVAAVGPGQTLQLNVAAWPPTPIYPPSPVVPPSPLCNALVGLLDSQTLDSQTMVQKVVSLPPGQAASIALPAVQLPVVAPNSMVLGQGVEGSGTGCAFTLEIIDTDTGATVATAYFPPVPIHPPDPIVPGNPIGGLSPKFGEIGIGPGQWLQLNLAAYPPDPVVPPVPIVPGAAATPPNPYCVAQIGFLDSSGNPAGPTKTVSLAPGQTDFIDLALPPGAVRTEYLPAVQVTAAPGGGPSACQASAQVFDVASGKALTLLNPVAYLP